MVEHPTDRMGVLDVSDIRVDYVDGDASIKKPSLERDPFQNHQKNGV